MEVKRYNVEQNGDYEPRISLVDENLIPFSPYTVIFLNSWITQGAIESKVRTAYELRFFLLHLSQAQPKNKDEPIGIDIIKRALVGKFLATVECKSFIEACRYKVTKKKSNLMPLSGSNRALQNAIHSANVSKKTIGDSTKNGRIKTALNFLECLYEEMHGKYRAPDFVNTNYLSAKHELEKGIKNKIQKIEEPCFEESKIPPLIYLRLLDIIRPESPDNPFKNSKLRNYLIVQMILETGDRRGAVSKLKISDCQFEGSGDQIRVTRTPNDPSDKRIVKPAQKTNTHSSAVDPEIMKELNGYIEHQRSRFTASEQHEFVFIAETDSKGTAGDPLSTKGINYIFEVLTEALGFHVHAHLVRHKWNELFSEATKDMSDAQRDKLRKYAMGWSRTTQMVDLYNAFINSVEVREIQRERQAEITSAKE